MKRPAAILIFLTLLLVSAVVRKIDFAYARAQKMVVGESTYRAVTVND
jgi:hypothetical protein